MMWNSRGRPVGAAPSAFAGSKRRRSPVRRLCIDRRRRLARDAARGRLAGRGRSRVRHAAHVLGDRLVLAGLQVALLQEDAAEHYAIGAGSGLLGLDTLEERETLADLLLGR